jgi:hypothetical protein
MNSRNQKRERTKLYLAVVFGKKRSRISATKREEQGIAVNLNLLKSSAGEGNRVKVRGYRTRSRYKRRRN